MDSWHYDILILLLTTTSKWPSVCRGLSMDTSHIDERIFMDTNHAQIDGQSTELGGGKLK